MTGHAEASSIETSSPVLLLDGAGVLFTNGLPHFLRLLSEQLGADRGELEKRFGALREPFWSGRMDEDAFWQALVDREIDRTQARELFETSYQPGPAALHLVDWSRVADCYAFSNHRGSWLRDRIERLAMGGYLAGAIASDDLHALKPDRRSYEQLLTRIDCSPDRAFMIDDKPRNIVGAEAAGLLGVCVLEKDWVQQVDSWLSTQLTG
jgi:putative hydrolase of the HAD superfamily